MFGQRFYNETTRRYVAIFGTLFNDIVIERKKNDGTFLYEMVVPINYGPMQKFLAALETNVDLNAPAITLPRMSFEINNISYDGSRKLTSLQRLSNTMSQDRDRLTSRLAPTPYNVDFTLNIMTKYAEDGTKILEQILPYFKPDQTLSVKLIDDLNMYFDIPVVLNSVSTQDTYEADFQTRRALLWELNFTVKGYYFGPKEEKKVVKFTKVSIMPNTTEGNRAPDVIPLPPEINEGTQKLTSEVLTPEIYYAPIEHYRDANEPTISQILLTQNLENRGEEIPYGFPPVAEFSVGDTIYFDNEIPEDAPEDEVHDFYVISGRILEDWSGLENEFETYAGTLEIILQYAPSGVTNNGAGPGERLTFIPTIPGDYYILSAQDPQSIQKFNVYEYIYYNDDPDQIDANNYIKPVSIATIQPGLTEDLKPTDRIENSIPYSNIDFYHDWDYIVQIENPSMYEIIDNGDE